MNTTKQATGEKAINAALAAGFEIVRHGRREGNRAHGIAPHYSHTLRDAAGRELEISIELGTSRLIKATAAGARHEMTSATWFGWRTGPAARSLPRLALLLARTI